MQKRIDPDRSHGEKLIGLFAKLLFSRRSHSLTELANSLRCSKQTVLRLIDKISASYSVQIEETKEGNRSYYRIKTLTGAPPALGLTEKELNALHMCQAFTQCLMGREIFEEATRALEKSQALVSSKKALPAHHFASYRPGSIDYTPHQDVVRLLIEAMEQRRVCKITYRRILAKRARTYYIKPLKLFSYYDTLYTDAHWARKPKHPDYDPPFEVHRIKKVEVTDSSFEFPRDYNFREVYNKTFGVWKAGSFKVEIEFKGYSAKWVMERIWSPDQKIIKMRGGKIKMSFSVSSDIEFIEWLLPFEDEAKLIKPEWLVEKVKTAINKMQRVYA